MGEPISGLLRTPILWGYQKRGLENCTISWGNFFLKKESGNLAMAETPPEFEGSGAARKMTQAGFNSSLSKGGFFSHYLCLVITYDT